MYYVLSDNSNWVISEISNELCNLNKSNYDNKLFSKQSDLFLFKKKVHYLDAYKFINKKIYFNKCTVSYFHGYPNNSLKKSLSNKFNNIVKLKNNFEYLHVSHNKMKFFFLDNGISSEKIIQIPICIDSKYLKPLDKTKNQLRKKYNLPKESFIIGSFQKDGNGWDKGLDPKLEKGPDIFIRTIKLLKKQVKEIFILLSGPSRGYIIKELNALGVKFLYVNLDKYEQIFELYNCIDIYLVTAREEGGPRAILECLSQHIPIVSTPVGQAYDMLKNSFYLSESFDEEELADKVYKYYILDQNSKNQLLNFGYNIASNNTYIAHKKKWEKLLFSN